MDPGIMDDDAVYHYNAADLSGLQTEQLDTIMHQMRSQPQIYAAFLPTLSPQVQALLQAAQCLELNQNYLLKSALPKLYKQQRIEQISVSSPKEIERLIDELTQKFPQQMAALMQLIKFCEQLQNLLQLGAAIQPCDATVVEMLQTISQGLHQLRATLIAESLIITEQPSEVMKKGNLFQTEARLLLDATAAAPSVRIRIISAPSAVRLLNAAAKCDQLPSEATIVNNQAKMTTKDGTMVSQFGKQMSLREIGTRSQTGNTRKQTVTEQKYLMLYEVVPSDALRSLLAYDDQIWALSFPIVLIVHANQLTDAYATIVWDRVFGDAEEGEWSRFAWLLNVTFRHMTGVKCRFLTDSDMVYFRKNKLCIGDAQSVSFQRFAKDKVSGAKFSFWAWFDAICILIKDKLINYWEKGYIMGFASKDEISEKLSSIGQPTFLLRFSDSQLGTISVSTFRHERNGSMQHLPFLLPSDQVEKADSLVELLRDFNQLRTVRFFCNKDYDIRDKGFFFDDADLGSKKSDSDKAICGYHKIKMVIKAGDDEDMDADDAATSRERSNSSLSVSSPEAFSSYHQAALFDTTPCYSPSSSQDAFANQQHFSQSQPNAASYKHANNASGGGFNFASMSMPQMTAWSNSPSASDQNYPTDSSLRIAAAITGLHSPNHQTS